MDKPALLRVANRVAEQIANNLANVAQCITDRSPEHVAERVTDDAW